MVTISMVTGFEFRSLKLKAIDLLYARRAKKAGANYSLRIIMEARRAGIPLSLAFAIIEQESNFQNVFGHDPTIFSGAGEVTKSKYLAYKRRRGHGLSGERLSIWRERRLGRRL